jgi:hypothetical protein
MVEALFSDQNESGIYVSTLGAKWVKGGLKSTASICRFNHQLQFVAAKEIVGAQTSFPLLIRGPRGTNMLSYDYAQPFRGVGNAVNDNLEPTDVPCSWNRELNLSMERCSYSSTDAECKEEPLDVEPDNGTATIQPDTFNLAHLALKLEAGTDPNNKAPACPARSHTCSELFLLSSPGRFCTAFGGTWTCGVQSNESDYR